jgi:hypothetical protein
MDEEAGCLICGQPDTNCFRSKRRAFSFDVAMVHLFEELIVCMFCIVQARYTLFPRRVQFFSK